MEYRIANRNDIELFVKNRIEFSSRYIKDVADFENKTRQYLNMHIDKDDLIVFLAVDNGSIIASCMACLYETTPLPSCLSGKAAVILNVYTRAEYRRKGHARALLNLLIEEAKRRGVERIRLDYTDDGFLLYKQLGFTLLEHQMQLIL